VRIYLVRHAHAVEEGPRVSDEHRWLTARGRRAAREVGARLHSEGVTIDAVLTSPLVRAVQTAELIAERLAFTEVIEALPPLSPGVPPRIAAAEFASRGAAVLVVGHEPSISGLGAFLCGRPSFPPFKKAQVMAVDDGRAQWALDPDTLQIDRLLIA
jgi:phosphohistidine phosphatase